jgi:ketosteroid isomerase-like protein
MKTSKDLAEELMSRFSAGDVGGVMDLMAEDMTWRVAGKPELFPVAGPYDKKRLRSLFERMLAQLENGLRMTVISSIAEGNSVAMEVESVGDLRNGRAYRQQYHFLITFRDGKVTVVHEYLDTQHAHDVWIRP